MVFACKQEQGYLTDSLFVKDRGALYVFFFKLRLAACVTKVFRSVFLPEPQNNAYTNTLILFGIWWAKSNNQVRRTKFRTPPHNNASAVAAFRFSLFQVYFIT